MLEFSDAPYHFFEAKPSPPLIWLGRLTNRAFVLPGKNHRINEIRIDGALEELEAARAAGDRVVFVINHPSHSDPQVVTEVQRRLGVPSCFMAAYDVFLRSAFAGWCMQRLGNFSIDREGGDRKAMAAAIDTIKEGRFALDIFPEGNVYLTNDRVTPFLDGTAFLALKARQALDNVPVRIVPVSLKFTHLSTPRGMVTDRLVQLGRDSGHVYEPGVRPMEAVLGLGAHLVADRLRAHGWADRIQAAPDAIFETLRDFTDGLVADCEKALSLEPKKERSLVERIRQVRSRVHQLRIADDGAANRGPELDGIADKAILAFRTHGYLEPYLTDHPTVDRYDETVERIAEDFYSRAMPRTGSRRVHARIGEPIDTGRILEEAGGKLRGAVGPLTREMEASVQAGIDEINATNDAPGARLVSEVA